MHEVLGVVVTSPRKRKSRKFYKHAKEWISRMEQCFSNFDVITTPLEDLLTTFFFLLQVMLLTLLHMGK